MLFSVKKIQDQSLIRLKKYGEVMDKLNRENNYIIYTLKVLL
jgi:hypothetical protein